MAAQEALLPREEALPFAPKEAALAARLYSEAARPLGREMDLAIAAAAMSYEARLWTLNADDFSDIAGLELYQPGS